eukprot:Sdes_comp18280_c0_seq3m7943
MEYPSRRFQIYLKSSGAPIDVYLVSRIEETDDLKEPDLNFESGPHGYNSKLDEELSLPTVSELQNAEVSFSKHSSPIPASKIDALGPLSVLTSDCSPYRPLYGSSHAAGGVVKLSPPPMDDDYLFSLEETEGISDLYDLRLVEYHSDLKCDPNIQD